MRNAEQVKVGAMWVRVESWSGALKPWQGRAYDASGNFLAEGGFCKTRGSAIESAVRAANKRVEVTPESLMRTTNSEAWLRQGTPAPKRDRCACGAEAVVRVQVGEQFMPRCAACAGGAR